LWNKLKAPVYCTPFTAAVARRKLGEAGLLDQVPLHEVLPGSYLELGCFTMEWVTLTHSIPEPNALVIQAAGRTVFHTGDWKLDPHPIEGEHYDDRRLLALGETGIEYVIGDSTSDVFFIEYSTSIELRRYRSRNRASSHGAWKEFV
jgi:ribonuclease J